MNLGDSERAPNPEHILGQDGRSIHDLNLHNLYADPDSSQVGSVSWLRTRGSPFTGRRKRYLDHHGLSALCGPDQRMHPDPKSAIAAVVMLGLHM